MDFQQIFWGSGKNSKKEPETRSEIKQHSLFHSEHSEHLDNEEDKKVQKAIINVKGSFIPPKKLEVEQDDVVYSEESPPIETIDIFNKIQRPISKPPNKSKYAPKNEIQSEIPLRECVQENKELKVDCKPTTENKNIIPNTVEENTIWIEKYRPMDRNYFMGNPKNVTELTQWVSKRSTNSGGPLVALLHGPPGVGKTSLAHIVLKMYNYNVIELNASMMVARNTDKSNPTMHNIYDIVHETISRQSLLGKSAIVLDEIDGAFDSETGVIANIIHLIDEGEMEGKGKRLPSWSPIICIANDVSSKKMRALAAKALTLRFFPIRYEEMCNYCSRICQAEGLVLSREEIGRVSKAANGDARTLCNILESFKLSLSVPASMPPTIMTFLDSSRTDGDFNLFESTKDLLYAYDAARNYSQRFLRKQKLILSDYNLMTLMIHQNILTAFDNKKSVQISMEEIRLIQRAQSLADVFERAMWETDESYGIEYSATLQAAALCISLSHGIVGPGDLYGARVEFPTSYFHAKNETKFMGGLLDQIAAENPLGRLPTNAADMWFALECEALEEVKRMSPRGADVQALDSYKKAFTTVSQTKFFDNGSENLKSFPAATRGRGRSTQPKPPGRGRGRGRGQKQTDVQTKRIKLF